MGDGIVSYNINDNYKANEFLTNYDKKVIGDIACHTKSFRIQSSNYDIDNSSAENEYNLWTSAFWHVVSETCFYEKTIHLTEKSFKPIVARQPFILLSTPGSLAYLRRYGFETFGSFIDESYDLETNPSARLNKVVKIVKDIVSLSADDKQAMYNSMLPILEHNFYHFYNNLYKICWEELEENLEEVIKVLEQKQDATSQHAGIKELDFELSSLMLLPGRHGHLWKDKLKKFAPKD